MVALAEQYRRRYRQRRGWCLRTLRKCSAERLTTSAAAVCLRVGSVVEVAALKSRRILFRWPEVSNSSGNTAGNSSWSRYSMVS